MSRSVEQRGRMRVRLWFPSPWRTRPCKSTITVRLHLWQVARTSNPFAMCSNTLSMTIGFCMEPEYFGHGVTAAIAKVQMTDFVQECERDCHCLMAQRTAIGCDVFRQAEISVELLKRPYVYDDASVIVRYKEALSRSQDIVVDEVDRHRECVVEEHDIMRRRTGRVRITQVFRGNDRVALDWRGKTILGSEN
jgi:hypothetical protein